LLTAAERRLRDLGFAYAMLAVYEANERARRFYEQAGWAADGERWLVERGGAGVWQLRYVKPLVDLHEGSA
jgi:hypothetical protein